MLPMKRYFDCIISFRTCNLRCDYCYITHTQSWGHALPKFRYDAERIGRALKPERLGGICLFNIVGEGETVLPPEIVGIIHSILKQGHYITLVTNGTISQRFDEIAALPPDCLSRLMVKFSFHYLELKRKNWMDKFFDNVNKVRKAGCSISLELTPTDDLIPLMDDIIALCQQRVGAPCHVTVARDERDPALPLLTKHTRAQYEEIWSRFQSDLFKFKLKVFGEKRLEFCYAGVWSTVLELTTGELHQCYKGESLQNIFEDPDRPIRWKPVGCHCPEPHCYNAHGFMTLGVIPSVPTPTLTDMRNRVCAVGSEWLAPNVKEFLSRKLGNANREFTWLERQYCEFQNRLMGSQLYRRAQWYLKRLRGGTSGQ